MVLRFALPVFLALAASCSRGEPVVAPRSDTTAARATPSADPELDRLIAAEWTDIEPAPIVGDALYLRRVSLDLTGRIPTPTQVAAFGADPRPNKREAWVDDLLASPAYAEHWAGVYADLLLAGRTKERKRVTEDTRAWLRDAFAQNRPYDAIVTELLTAEGRFEEPGPYGFLVSHGDRDNLEALTGKTAKLFLGITLECAQCHDHPSDPRYSQEDFYAMAAYFSRSKFRIKKRVGVLVDRKRGQMRLPTATDGPMQRTGEAIDPAFLSREATSHPGGLRSALAQDIVASDLFAKTVVARTWMHLFGSGLTPRWDDLGGEHDAGHPPALEHLAARFVESGYDLRDLLRTIVLSDAYGRASSVRGRSPQDARDAQAVFAQARTRPLDADQLFRSLLIATAADSGGGPGLRNYALERKERTLQEYRFVFADDEMQSTDTFSGSVPQALLLLNGDLVTIGTSDTAGTTVHDILDRFEDPAARVDALYARVYGRAPTPPQRERALATLQAREHGSSAYEDLMHAMLLSSEFLTIH